MGWVQVRSHVDDRPCSARGDVDPSCIARNKLNNFSSHRFACKLDNVIALSCVDHFSTNFDENALFVVTNMMKTCSSSSFFFQP